LKETSLTVAELDNSFYEKLKEAKRLQASKANNVGPTSNRRRNLGVNSISNSLTWVNHSFTLHVTRSLAIVAGQSVLPRKRLSRLEMS